MYRTLQKNLWFLSQAKQKQNCNQSTPASTSFHHHHQSSSSLDTKGSWRQWRKVKCSRTLRCEGSDSKVVRTLAHTLHQLVQRYSKLSQEVKREERKRSRQSESKACHNFWWYARSVLDSDDHTSIMTTFTRETAKSYFHTTYSATAVIFD